MVRNIFTQGQLSVGMKSGQDLYPIEPIDQHFSSLFKIFRILGSPPIFQITVFIVLTPLIVESVCHLMSDDHSDRTIIKSIVSIHIEERIL